CLVIDQDCVGYLQRVRYSGETAVFHPIELPAKQRQRAEAYIQIRDIYLSLYNQEALYRHEYKDEREKLNRLYDAFVKKFGYLNSADNIKLIKTDSAGKEVPYLERVKGGVIRK